MMTITVDYNNDEISIEDGSSPNALFKITGNIGNVQILISEILNRINYSGVTLRTINEDVIRTVEEW